MTDSIAAPVPAPAPVPEQETPAAETKPQPPATKDWAQEYRRLEADAAKKSREHIIERRKWDADRKSTGERLSRLAELEKRELGARLNPNAYLQSIYGDKWYEKVTESKLNGVPPADLIQSELAKMRDDFEARLKARDEAGAQSLQARQASQLEEARAGIRLEAEDFYATSAAEYPILERLGDKSAVAVALAQRIEAEFHATSRRDESGRVVRQGKVLTAREAAELVEGEMLAVVDAALKAEKYRPRFAPPPNDLTTEKEPVRLLPKSQPSIPPKPNGQQQQRKSLSNDITGSTKGDEPRPLTDAQRRQKAIEAYNSVRARKATSAG